MMLFKALGSHSAAIRRPTPIVGKVAARRTALLRQAADVLAVQPGQKKARGELACWGRGSEGEA